MITRSDILNIAKLSKLHVDEKELEGLTCDMKKIIQFANEISKAQGQYTEEENTETVPDRLRNDNVEESFSQESILKNAQGGKNGFFCVKKSKKFS